MLASDKLWCSFCTTFADMSQYNMFKQKCFWQVFVDVLCTLLTDEWIDGSSLRYGRMKTRYRAYTSSCCHADYFTLQFYKYVQFVLYTLLDVAWLLNIFSWLLFPYGCVSVSSVATYQGPKKMATVLQTTILSVAFSWTSIHVFQILFRWSLFLVAQ